MNPLFAEIFKDEIAAAEARGEAKGEARGEAKGEVKGAKKNLIANVRELMKNLHFTATQAMDALGVPADKQKEYADLI